MNKYVLMHREDLILRNSRYGYFVKKGKLFRGRIKGSRLRLAGHAFKSKIYNIEEVKDFSYYASTPVQELCKRFGIKRKYQHAN